MSVDVKKILKRRYRGGIQWGEDSPAKYGGSITIIHNGRMGSATIRVVSGRGKIEIYLEAETCRELSEALRVEAELIDEVNAEKAHCRLIDD